MGGSRPRRFKRRGDNNFGSLCCRGSLDFGFFCLVGRKQKSNKLPKGCSRSSIRVSLFGSHFFFNLRKGKNNKKHLGDSTFFFSGASGLVDDDLGGSVGENN